jgi:hypothetical protein
MTLNTIGVNKEMYTYLENLSGFVEETSQNSIYLSDIIDSEILNVIRQMEEIALGEWVKDLNVFNT